MPSRFDTDTAVVPLGDGLFDARIDHGWWIERGPNGGYVAALIVRALVAAVDDVDRHLRSLTIHYLAPAVEGPAQLAVTTERSGRMVRYLSARLRQGDRLIATAQAAFAHADEQRADVRRPQLPPAIRSRTRAVTRPIRRASCRCASATSTATTPAPRGTARRARRRRPGGSASPSSARTTPRWSQR